MKKEKHYLESVKWGVIPIVNYRGCLVEKLKDGEWKVLGKTVVSVEDVDRVIDEVGAWLDKSVSSRHNQS
jgi:hypothetical protein